MSRSGIVRWNQREVVNAIASHVQENMEEAAKLVETDARHRFLRIREPEFGLKYRRYLALYRLTSVVGRDGNAVEAAIGITKGKKGGDYGFWIEVGSKTAPAHPWLRPALMTNLRDVMRIICGG